MVQTRVDLTEESACASLLSAAAIALVAGASVTMFLPNRDAAAQAGGVYINAVDLVVIPSEMPKFFEAIKENGANAVKEPGCREFNVTALPNNPNHVFLYEVYDNAAASLLRQKLAGNCTTTCQWIGRQQFCNTHCF